MLQKLLFFFFENFCKNWIKSNINVSNRFSKYINKYSPNNIKAEKYTANSFKMLTI